MAGETGSGKTTQLPKICLELGRGVRGAIGHTQPRRIAARTVAERIAEELDVAARPSVGYQVRFTDRAGDDTAVKVMTDGILLAEIQHDRMLRRYDTLIIDEAHERSLNIDFLLGYLKQLLPRRPDLKLDHHLGDDRPGALRPALRRTRRSSRSPAGPTRSRSRYRPPADGRRPGPGDLRRGRRARPAEAPATCWSSCRGEREIRDTADALRRQPGRPDRGAAAVRPAVRGRAAPGLPAARRPPGRARHQRRRDLAHRPRHQVRGRPRHRADLPLQPPDEGAAAADRAGLAGLARTSARAAAGVPPTASASGSTPRRTSRPARVHRAGDAADQPGLGDPADDRARARRRRPRSRSSTRRTGGRSPTASRCCTSWARSTRPRRTRASGSPRSAGSSPSCRSTRGWAGWCSRRTATAACTRCW